MLTMCSVTELPYKSGTIKGVLDTMAIGDTRTGKSLMAQNMLTKLNMGGYINGENARLTGVLGGVVRMGDSWLITWGAVPLNDKGLCVIDEAQNIKNPNTEQTKAIKSVTARTKIALTGTPIENKLMDYWSIFDFVNKGYLSTKDDFKRSYVVIQL